MFWAFAIKGLRSPGDEADYRRIKMIRVWHEKDPEGVGRALTNVLHKYVRARQPGTVGPQHERDDLPHGTIKFASPLRFSNNEQH